MDKYCVVNRFPEEEGKPRAEVLATVALRGERVEVGRAIIVDDVVELFPGAFSSVHDNEFPLSRLR